MSIGGVARKILGDRFFPFAGRIYRSIFVDLTPVCKCLPELKEKHLLDIGGGDGDLLNLILDAHPDLQVTLIDIAPLVGSALRPEVRSRVTCLPETGLKNYASMKRCDPDYVLISDVMHHIAPSEHEEFLTDLKAVVGSRGAIIIIKDVEPGHFISHLSVFSDRYISGDRTVELIGRTELVSLMKSVFPGYKSRETSLFEVQKPNYCLVFSSQTGSSA